MIKILFLLFIFVPVVEIYFLIQVGSLIGAVPTIALILFTAALGTILIRLQGLKTLADIRAALDRGEIPADSLIRGVLLLFAGLCLLTPGFVTDSIGFLCLIPAIQNWLIIRFLRDATTRVYTRKDSQAVVIEGEFNEEGQDKNIPVKRLDRQ